MKTQKLLLFTILSFLVLFNPLSGQEAMPEGLPEDVAKHFLNGMEFSFFIAMMGFAIAGVVVQFLFDVIKTINYDTRTEKKFNWKSFWLKGGARMLGGFIILTISVIFFEQIATLLFNVSLTGAGADVSASVKLTGWSAFLLGLSIDSLIKIVVSFGSPGQFVKEVQTVVRKNGQ